MSEEEKKAIEFIKSELQDEKVRVDYQRLTGLYGNLEIEILLNLIEKQSKEISHQIEKRANQRKELAILNAKQIEFNKLVNTVNSYKGQFKRQQKEIEELKKPKYIINFKTNEITTLTNNFISKDKLKAKIEEIDIEIQCCEYADDDTEEYKQDIEKEKRRLLRDKAVLQSLLEKE